MLTDRTFAFALSIVTVLVIWWIISRKVPTVHVFLYGDSRNPYIREITNGISRQCDLLKATLHFILYEDIAKNRDRYHEAIASSPARSLVCRVVDEETLSVLRRTGKRAVVIGSERFTDIITQYPDVVIQTFNSETPEFEDDSIVLVPDADFPPVNTNGAVVAANHTDTFVIEQLVVLTRTYSLQQLYIYGNLPGIDDANIQAGLKRAFMRIRTLPVMGASEGKSAVSALLMVMSDDGRLSL